MTAKRFIDIAAMLADERPGRAVKSVSTEIDDARNLTVDAIAYRMAAICRADNPRFDDSQFLYAAGVDISAVDINDH